MPTITRNDVKRNLDRYYDDEFGGFHTILDDDHKIYLTEEKLLEDQVWILLSSIVSNDTQNVERAAHYIVDSLDELFGGVIEFRESYGLINELGNVKTSYWTLLAAYGLVNAGKYLKNNDLVTKGEELLYDVENNFYNQILGVSPPLD